MLLYARHYIKLYCKTVNKIIKVCALMKSKTLEKTEIKQIITTKMNSKRKFLG